MAASKPSGQDDHWVDASGAVVRRDRRRKKPEGPGEKRQFERIALYRRARATELDPFGTPGAPFECSIQNISRGGLGLIAARMVHAERRVFIEVPGQTEEENRIFFGMVRQCRYVEGQGYFVGVQFEAMPKSGPVDAWLNQRRRTRAN